MDQGHHPPDQDDPPAENDPLVAGGYESEAVKDSSHVTRRDISILRLSTPSLGDRLGAHNLRNGSKVAAIPMRGPRRKAELVQPGRRPLDVTDNH
jgi:hypothetical protein